MISKIKCWRQTLVIIAVLAGIISATANPNGKRQDGMPATIDSVRSALRYQIERYPASQYRDVYKNFMQDFFGPGHILSDTAASARYLRSELALDEPFDGPLYEPTGYRGNFYRVNLSLLRDSTVPHPVFFDAFVESVQAINPPDGKDWMKTWRMIDSVITAEGLHFVNEEADREDLERQFADGDYIVHHSQRFNDSSRFHYRIISRDNFRSRILPYIHKKSKVNICAD